MGKIIDEIIRERMSIEASSRVAKAQLRVEKKDARGQYDLALHYQAGWGGLEKNIIKAKDLLEKAAKQGHAGAAYELAQSYLTGENRDTQKVRYYISCGLKSPLSDKFNTPTYKQKDYVLLLRGIHTLLETTGDPTNNTDETPKLIIG